MIGRFVTVALAATLLSGAYSSPVAALQPPHFVIEPAQAPEMRGAIALGTGGVAGAPPESWHWLNGELGVRNVSRATITPVLPPPGAATGAAVIVAPGGGFLGLSMDAEGFRVAHWLADHGIAAFVLMYRTLPTPPAFEDFRSGMISVMTGGKASFAPPRTGTPPEALADALAALRIVRARATEWNVEPGRIGMMGFSAGAFTALSVAMANDTSARPAFVASIYGPLNAVAPPPSAPPLYVAIAEDDFLAQKGRAPVVESWAVAGAPVEYHLFQSGGHGFGLGNPGTTTSDWIEGFRRWLAVNGFLAPRPVGG